MGRKLFVFGLPGSGKSSVAHEISLYVRDKQWTVTHINDYTILNKMYQEDTRGQFKSAEYGGFDVLDFSVFDTALQKLEQQVNQHLSIQSNEIILIEFSRNDYKKAFQQFSQDFLQGAYFLYLSVDLEICKLRIRERIVHPTTLDDHFVSEYIFSAYYNKENRQVIPHLLEEDFGIDKQRIGIIENEDSLQEVLPEVFSFIDLFLPVPLPV